MAEKKKSTPNAKVLTVLLIVLFVGSCVCLALAISFGDYLKGDNNNETTPDTQASTAAEITPTTEAAQPEATTAADTTEAEAPSRKNLAVYSSYEAKSAVDENGNSVNLSAYFGSGFAAYGGTLTFEGESFAVNMGVSSGSSSTVGTYELLSENEIQLNFDNSDITVATITVSGDSVVSIDVTMDDITVTFTAVGE